MYHDPVCADVQHGTEISVMKRWRSKWPSAMSISVNEADRGLLELLYVRSAWHLAAGLPDVEPPPDPGASQRPDHPSQETWSEWWREAWQQEWTVRQVEPPGVRAPSWTRQFGAGGLDLDALERWIISLTPVSLPTLREEPERHVISALTSAWESGLKCVIVLPFRGNYSWTASPHCLVVSRVTRAHRDRYSDALLHFSTGADGENGLTASVPT